MMEISIIVPCYDEQDTIQIFFQETEKIRKLVNYNFEYIFIDDGSTDDTLNQLRMLSSQHQSVHYLSFSRNFGKEAAIYAGLNMAKGEMVAIMDADLQDPPELLPEMIQIIQEGYDCVATSRKNRDGEPLFRSIFAKLFYRIINKIGEVELQDGARDFRLMTRPVVEAILQLKEYNRFSKGLFSWVGFKTKYIQFDNRERIAGKTSWSFWQLVRYSIDGFVNFSEVPLNIASFIGAFSCIGAGVAMIFIIIKTLIFKDPTSGWPSLVSIILFMGGIQLLCIGIIGKYIGKIFLETKKRPIYLIKEMDNSTKFKDM